MSSFLLLATRADDDVADAEYRAFLHFGGLAESELVRVRLELGPLDELVPDLDVASYSGVLMGGSPFTSSDPEVDKPLVQRRVERELAQLVGDIVKLDVPFLGACYGISTLGKYLGGELDGTYGEPVGAVAITLSQDGRRDPLLRGLPDTFDAFVGHKEALRAPPAGTTLLAGSQSCPVQMFRAGEHQYATQFHPELDVAGIVQRMRAYRDSGYFRPEELDELIEAVARARVVWPGRILENFVARYR